jgi:hypothetical protein
MAVGSANNEIMIFFGLKESSGTYTTNVYKSSIVCNFVFGIYFRDSKVYALGR